MKYNEKRLKFSGFNWFRGKCFKRCLHKNIINMYDNMIIIYIMQSNVMKRKCRHDVAIKIYSDENVQRRGSAGNSDRFSS